MEIVPPKRCLSALVLTVLYELIQTWISSILAVLLSKGFTMSICLLVCWLLHLFWFLLLVVACICLFTRICEVVLQQCILSLWRVDCFLLSCWVLLSDADRHNNAFNGKGDKPDNWKTATEHRKYKYPSNTSFILTPLHLHYGLWFLMFKLFVSGVLG